MSNQTTLFPDPEDDEPFPPPPPTGPRATAHGANTRWAYRDWRASADGQRLFAWVEEDVLARFIAGERRISIRIVCGEARDALHVPLNDRYCPWIADDLIAQHRELLDVIERRRRRRADS